MAPHLIKLRQIEGGLPAGGGVGGGPPLPVATFTPTRIPAGQTFTVPPDTQVLIALPITIEGTLQVDGSLVMV